jgi:arsenate reductase (glutaredoxin)
VEISSWQVTQRLCRSKLLAALVKFVSLQKNIVKKIYHLSSCTTCQGMIKDMALENKRFQMQDIKFEKITSEQLKEMKDMIGSYEALFSRRALKYKELGLNNKHLNEEDYRKYILQEYTFLKRPVIIINDKIFVGSEKKTKEAIKQSLK